MPTTNEATRHTDEQEAIKKLGKVLLRIVLAIVEAPEYYGPILLRKIDIKDGFWRMISQTGSE